MKNKRNLIPIDINKIKELIDKNYCYTDIAKELNISLTTLKRRMSIHGLKTKINPAARVVVDYDVVKNLIDQRYSTHKIANKLNTSQTNVRYWLKKWGLKTNSSVGFNDDIRKKQNRFSYEKAQKRGMERKMYFIKQKGGKCNRCGYNKNYAALSFHHLDPNIKTMGLDIRKMTNNNLQTLQEEVDKCILLCMNCHMEIEYSHLEIGGP